MDSQTSRQTDGDGLTSVLPDEKINILTNSLMFPNMGWAVSTSDSHGIFFFFFENVMNRPKRDGYSWVKERLP